MPLISRMTTSSARDRRRLSASRLTGTPRGRRRTGLVVAAVVATAALLAGCASGQTGTSTSSSGASTSSGADSKAFPVSIPDAFGTTTIKAAPTRVVTWGWGSTDAAIALGVDPVAMPYQSYGGNSKGVLPWIADAVKSKGMKLPEVLPNSSDDPPYEAIAAAKPDLILAPYSGLTAKQDALLKAIAPTVAYPDQPWTTPWKDVVTIVGKALGRSAEATTVLAKINQRIASEAASHPDLKGKTVAMVWDTAGTFYVYRDADPRVQFAEELGMKSAPSVESLSNGSQSFYYTLSYEKVPQVTSDVLVSFANTPALEKTFLGTSYGSAMQQVKKGAVAEITGTQLVAAVSPPTALSLPWGMTDYVNALSKAAKAAG